ncbi:unnamed protein product [Polarella glacialis]|uniref:Uncharacterized protein n=1 Tax=Polarella glacialis TaxID=89957 RepID=A0A813HH52_POLGL|nr:unnamed protein product [Polarella glacialis]
MRKNGILLTYSQSNSYRYQRLLLCLLWNPLEGESPPARFSAPRHLCIDVTLCLLEAVDGGANSRRRAGGQRPAASSNGLLAGLGLALPNAARDTLHVLLAAEAAHVPGALLDLVTLDDLPQRCAIASAVLPCDANLLGVLRHLNWR